MAFVSNNTCGNGGDGYEPFKDRAKRPMTTVPIWQMCTAEVYRRPTGLHAVYRWPAITVS